jgi:hypothetical protein
MASLYCVEASYDSQGSVKLFLLEPAFASDCITIQVLSFKRKPHQTIQWDISSQQKKEVEFLEDSAMKQAYSKITKASQKHHKSHLKRSHEFKIKGKQFYSSRLLP